MALNDSPNFDMVMYCVLKVNMQIWGHWRPGSCRDWWTSRWLRFPAKKVSSLLPCLLLQKLGKWCWRFLKCFVTPEIMYLIHIDGLILYVIFSARSWFGLCIYMHFFTFLLFGKKIQDHWCKAHTKMFAFGDSKCTRTQESFLEVINM